MCNSGLALPAILALLASPSAGAQGTQAPSPLPVTTLEQLTEIPQRPPALPVTRLSSRADLDGPRTVSVAMSRPTPIRSMLQLLFRGTPFSTVVHSAARGAFAGELRNLTLRQALESVLFPAGLDYEVRGTVIRVFPRRPTTRLFPIDVLEVRRSWESRTGAAGSIVSSSFESDAVSELDRGIRALLSTEGRHHIDRRAGVVHVTDFAERLEQVGLYLETVQLRSTRQVRIDVQVIRVLLKSGVVSIGAAPGIVSDVAQLFRALGDAGTVETLATPRLLAMNNQPAIVSLEQDGEMSVLSLLSLVVTPQISSDGFIQLSVVPRLSDGSAAARGHTPAPAVSQSDTVLRIREGETVAISGLPYATGPQQRADVLVLLTPSIVVPSVSSQAGQR